MRLGEPARRYRLRRKRRRSSGIPRALAERLATASEAVAERLESGNPCEGLLLATRLERTARTAIANERIPPALAGELLASIQDLERSVDCAPAAPAARAARQPTQTVTVEVQTDEDEQKDKPREEPRGQGPRQERRARGGRLSSAAVDESRYSIRRLLGSGGMARVYLAWDGVLKRPVALKLLTESLSADDAVRARFVREGELAARLAHPNVVRVYDAGGARSSPYIVMEYVEGTTLADKLAAGGPLPPPEVARLAAEVCSGLDHAHAAGLVHRDIKPHNLLLGRDGVVKIADFGIAHAADGSFLTGAGTVLGSAAYLAPEQARGEAVSPASDVYSLGVVLYELLTARTPYAAETLPELIAQQTAGSPPAPSRLADDVPAPLDGLVLACLARDPKQRPPVGVLEADLRRLAPPEAPTRVLPPSDGPESRPTLADPWAEPTRRIGYAPRRDARACRPPSSPCLSARTSCSHSRCSPSSRSCWVPRSRASTTRPRPHRPSPSHAATIRRSSPGTWPTGCATQPASRAPHGARSSAARTAPRIRPAGCWRTRTLPSPALERRSRSRAARNRASPLRGFSRRTGPAGRPCLDAPGEPTRT